METEILRGVKMKVLYMMADRMTNKDLVYRMTVVELARRGYGIGAAKSMIRNSGILDLIKDDDWYWTRDLDENDWADWVINNCSIKKAV